jgi:hypothetical protein
MPRKRIGDGPSPKVLGRLLLALVHRVENQALDGAGAGATAAELAGVLGLSATQVRTYAAELARARCLRIGRASAGRREDSGRYAQAFTLPPVFVEHGPARAPRLCPVALIVETSGQVTDQLGYALREMSTVPVAVPSPESAMTLLKHLGFELVLTEAPTSDGVAWSMDLSRLRDAGRRAGCGSLLVVGAVDHLLLSGLGTPAALPGLGDRQYLASALADVLNGPSDRVIGSTPLTLSKS